MDLASFYEDDLPSSHNIDMELVSWATRWSEQQVNLPSRPDLTLRQCDFVSVAVETLGVLQLFQDLMQTLPQEGNWEAKVLPFSHPKRISG